MNKGKHHKTRIYGTVCLTLFLFICFGFVLACGFPIFFRKKKKKVNVLSQDCLSLSRLTVTPSDCELVPFTESQTV